MGKSIIITHDGKESFIAALSDGKLQLQVMKQELQNMEKALSHAIKLEVFEQMLACQGTMVNDNDGHATCWPCSVCTVTGLLEAGETASLREPIGDLRSTLVQVITGMAALANGLSSFEWSYHSIGGCVLCQLHPRCPFQCRWHRHLDTWP